MKKGILTPSLMEKLEKLDKIRYSLGENTLDLAFEVYDLCKNIDYEVGMAFSLLVIGQAFVETSRYEEAINYLFDSIKISQKQDICDLQILGYINLGNMYFDLGNYETSIEYYHSAEKLTKVIGLSKNYFKDNKNELYIAKIKNNIGEINRLFGLYEEAKKYYLIALDLEKESYYKASFGTTFSNLGITEYYLGNYEIALMYFEKAIKIILFYEFEQGLIETYGMLALVYEKLGDYIACEKYFSLAIEISADVDYAYNQVDLLMNFSRYLDHVGKTNLAIEKLEESYQISDQKKMYAKSMEICKTSILLYEKKSDEMNKNKYYKLYFENERKLEPIENENRAKNLKTKIELESLESKHKNIQEESETFREKAEELIEIIKNISIINNLGEKITTTSDLDIIYEMLFSTIQGVVQVETFGVGLFDPEERKICYFYYVEHNKRVGLVETNYDNESSLAVKCLRGNKTIVINDMATEYLGYVDDVNYITAKKENEHLNSAIFCPLIIDQNLIGVMTVQANAKNSFTTLVVEMIKALSSYGAIAINNAIKTKNLILEVEQRRNVQEQLETINKKLVYLSENDGLTNIPNRRKFDAVMNEEWLKAVKQKKYLSFIILDIDFFKQYNDHFGHAQGDQCLILISEQLKKSLTGDFFAARYGGDEFVILLPNSELATAIEFGENFRKKIEQMQLRNDFSKISKVVTITLGICTTKPNESVEIIDLIRQADMNLYQAKENGKNQVVGSLIKLGETN